MLAQLNGQAAGQTVFHIHFHIIPRSSGIDLRLHAREKADFEKLKALAAKIAAAIR
jgi:histidine triad (HIT) family protein